MRTVSTSELAHHLEQILDSVECQGDSVLVTRNNRTIARILPGVARMTALEAMSDLYGIVAEEAAQDKKDFKDIPGLELAVLASYPDQGV